ncbi:MAG: CBS domain-containing protein [Planctomycetes bacterium]|nr:CBS domain-containing protein [Planctomycetota bacterium]
MQTVHDLLKSKGRVVWTINPDTSVSEALKLMSEKNLGALIVTDASLHVEGIFSERDFVRKFLAHEKNFLNLKVKDFMTDKVICVTPDRSVQECLASMTDKHIRHLPVLENDQLIGLISIGDLVKAVIAGQEFTIEQLNNYITTG